MRRRLGAAVAILIAVLELARSALAAEHVQAIVLMAPRTGTVVVHHQGFGGMPAMTMTFAVPAALRLRPGDRIGADVDRTRDPWMLSHIEVLGSQMPATVATDAPVLRPGDRLPDGAFVDQRGQPFALRTLDGARYALTFAYTRCADPAMCPLIGAKYRWLQAHLRRPATLVEISLDPAYDRPPVLARYGSRLGADPSRWHLLTGEPRRVLDFAARLGIVEHSAGPVAIVHSERLAIVGRDGRIERLFDGAAWSPSQVLTALQRT